MVEEVVVERCVAEAEVVEVDAVAEEEPDRLRHSAPWQPEEEWDARKYPCLARNSARNNQIAFHSFFGHESSNDGYALHVVLDVMGFRRIENLYISLKHEFKKMISSLRMDINYNAYGQYVLWTRKVLFPRISMVSGLNQN